jgi:cell division septation protein DedD
VVSGTGIALLGFAVGLVAGSLLEGPRLLIEWVRGPVRGIEMASADPTPVETGPLPELSELHRRAPARPAAPRPARKVEAEAPAAARPAPARNAPPIAAPAAPAPPPPREVVDALRREVEARAPAAPAPAPPAPGPAEQGAAVIQVASTPDAAEAQRIVARLRSGGFDAFSIAVRPNGSTTHRVRVRASGNQTPAAVAERLRAQGFETWITRD